MTLKDSLIMQFLDEVRDSLNVLVQSLGKDTQQALINLKDAFWNMVQTLKDIDHEASSWVDSNFQSAPSVLMVALSALMVCTVLAVTWGKGTVDEEKEQDLKAIEEESTLTDDLLTMIRSKTVLKKLVGEIESFQEGARQEVVKDALALAILNDRINVLNDILNEVHTHESKLESPSDDPTRELID